MKTVCIKEILEKGTIGTSVIVRGWVRTKRESKAVTFININDGSTINNIQVVVDPTQFESDVLSNITTGACVFISGELIASQQKIEVFGLAAATDYPLQPKRHSLEFLREIAHLRPRTATFSAILRIRHALSFAIHKFYNDKGFFYLHTPIITGSDCEGAGEMFRVTTMDMNNLPKNEDGSINYKEDFFGKETNLTVSGQLEGELGAMALSKMGLLERLNFVISNRFERLTYTEAIEILKKSKPFQKKQFKFPVEWGVDLQSEHERYLVEKEFKKPVILTNYPTAIKSFYMKQNDDGTVRAMDVLIPGIGEIIGGSQREDNYEKLKNRALEVGIDQESIWWYLETRKFGTAPHSGFGLGFERLVMFVTGMSNIRDVIPFPRTPKNAEF